MDLTVEGAAMNILWCPGSEGDDLPVEQRKRATGRIMDKNPSRTLEPLHFVQKADRVLEAIRTAIVNGGLAPGQPLRDRELAEQLGVSRTPVREALFRLENTGLVVTSERGGWSVAPLTDEDIHELFEVRRLLEPLGIRRLGEDDDERMRDELATFFDEFRNNVPNDRIREYLECDHSFHNLIVNCSANRRVRYFYWLMEQQIQRGRYFLSMGYEGRVEENLEEHLAICDAVGRGDWPGAEEALLHHLAMGEKTMIAFLRHVQEEQA
jgi:GntR family transcriptional regulator, rspAB operon transcriptional repressor